MICRRPGRFVGAMDDGNRDRESRRVQRRGRVRVPLCETIAIELVEILDVELNSPVAVTPAGSDHRVDTAALRHLIAEQSSQRGLIESFVHEQGHHLYMMLLCKLQDARVDAAEESAERVDGVALWAEDADLIDVRDQAAIGIFAVGVIEEALALRAQCRGAQDERECNQFEAHVGIKAAPAAVGTRLSLRCSRSSGQALRSSDDSRYSGAPNVCTKINRPRASAS